jgi:O-antigen ligase
VRRSLKLSLALSLALNGALIVFARYRLSYDAYVHMFFADHYRQNWWALWEPRWYTGFSVTSYPPLVHQVMGLIARLTGAEVAFVIVLLAVTTTLPLAVYRFARVFYGVRASVYAALAASVVPSVYLTAYTFGQLPTLVGLWFALFGLALLGGYLKSGRLIDLSLSVGLIALTAAAHHGTLLFLPWAGAAVAGQIWLNGRTRWKVFLRRLFAWGLSSGAVILIVIWPFWQWWSSQSMQVPIDHLSRHNFILDPGALTLFFWPMYGPLLLVMAWYLYTSFRSYRNRVGYTRPMLIVLVGILFILGLGGTTLLPRLLFGSQWEWLTYDRFALWASIALLPLTGEFVIRLRWWIRRRAVAARRLVSVGGLAALALCAIYAASLPTLLPTQPRPVDLQPLADFLAQDRRADWRYLSFGFGDQITRLSLMTPASTLDGSYHTARGLSFLRDSGIGQIDSIYWMPHGLDALDEILSHASVEGVRWGFVNLPAYRYILSLHGWIWRQTLSNGVEVWENPYAVRAAEASSVEAGTALARLSWGVLPISALALTSLLALVRRWQMGVGEASAGIPAAGVILNRVSASLKAARRFATGLLPVAIGFWYFGTVYTSNHPGVYFTYDSALFFLSDVVVLAVILLRLTEKLLSGLTNRYVDRRSRAGRFKAGRMDPTKAKFEGVLADRVLMICSLGIVVLSLVSVSWSIDPPISLYFALHLALMSGLFLTLRSDPGSWKYTAIGCCAVLFIESAVAVLEYATQSTAFLTPLGSIWPGELTAQTPGASAVELANGARLLRAYGTLPHPNILGGMLIGWLVGPLALLYILQKSWINSVWRAALLGLLGLGVLAIGLTFSRSAWVGLSAGGVYLLRYGRQSNRRLTAGIGLISAASLALVATSQIAALSPRLGSASTPLETRSSLERRVLTQESLSIIEDKPFTGTGVGTFALASIPGRAGIPISEPVHNIPLLAAGELGLPGGLLSLAVGIACLWRVRSSTRPVVVVFSAVLLGLFCISLFDHYLWSQAPGRELLWMTMGVWAGQIRTETHDGSWEGR